MWAEIKQNKEDMEEKKVYLKSEDVDFLRRKFKEITEYYIIQGCDKDKVQREFGKLFSVIEEKYSNSENIRKSLKPFSLEAVKQGKPVCTRDGRNARIICFDAKCNLPIIALITQSGGDESLARYKSNGKYTNLNESDCDLMMLPEKKEGWYNVYKSCIYSTKEEAEKLGKINCNFIKTIKVKWEE